MATITNIFAREILDSRGIPTVECVVELSDGSKGIAGCPSGTSTGKFEAVELRDNNPDRYNGQGVLKAIEHINSLIAKELSGKEASDQNAIDRFLCELDGTENKSKLGANAILPVSIAILKASAISTKMPLFVYIRSLTRIKPANTFPTPAFNLINGGLHGNPKLNFQEFHVIPNREYSFEKALEIGVTIYKTLGKNLKEHNLSTLIGHEGGYGPDVSKNADALYLLSQAIIDSGYKIGTDVSFGLDAAASNFFQNGHYAVRDKGNSISPQNLMNFYKELNSLYPMVYLEDPFSEEEWGSWMEFRKKLPQSVTIIGDDLTVTNPKRLQKALEKQVITGIIIKPNQIGTITETLEVIEHAKQNHVKIVVSHRSGETNDDFIADLAVAVESDYAKFGAPARGERVAKYNRLKGLNQLLL